MDSVARGSVVAVACGEVTILRAAPVMPRLSASNWPLSEMVATTPCKVSREHLLFEIAVTPLCYYAEIVACLQVLTSTKDIEMWGDGLQTRSFTFIDDCVEGILRITKSDFKEPLNLGSSEMVSAYLSQRTRSLRS